MIGFIIITIITIIIIIIIINYSGLAGFKSIQVTDQALLTHYSSKILLLLLLLLVLLCKIELFFLPKDHWIEMFLSRRAVLNTNVTVNVYFVFGYIHKL